MIILQNTLKKVKPMPLNDGDLKVLKFGIKTDSFLYGIATLELLLNYNDVSAYSKDSAPFRHWHLNNSKGGKQ